MSTGHLNSIGMINCFKLIGRGSKAKSRLECRHRKLGGETKKGISCMLLNPLVYTWRPRRDFNPCRRRERPDLSAR